MSVISKNEWQYYKGILPSLPERVISGLPYSVKISIKLKKGRKYEIRIEDGLLRSHVPT